MELFHPFPVIRSNNFFNKSLPNWSNDSKVDFRNRKWNYLNRKWNYFSPFQSSDQKTSLTKVSPIGLRTLKWISETGKELSKQEMELFFRLLKSNMFLLLCGRGMQFIFPTSQKPINVHAIFWSQNIVQFDSFPSVNHSPNW